MGMKERVRKRFHGIEKPFDRWWDKKNGGYALSKSLRQYTWWNDIRGIRRRNHLVQAFNTYIRKHGLE